MLAIVIPYYKIAFFEETLKSLANQTNKQFIVYIGDDASKDDPTFLLKKYKSQFLLEYHRFNNNLGGVSLVRQWERCIALSKEEEWLMILGDDDYLGNNVVELFYKYFQEFNSKANVIRFASRIVKQELNTISKVYNHPIWEKATDAYFKKFIEKFLVLNICSNKPIKIISVINRMNKVDKKFKYTAQSSKELKKIEVNITHGNNLKIKKLIKNFKFTKFDLALSKTINWYVKNKIYKIT